VYSVTIDARGDVTRDAGPATKPDATSRRAVSGMTRQALRLTAAAALAGSFAACGAPADGPPDGPLSPIGCFADVVTDGEHEDGYAAQLWSTGDAIAGFVTVHRGLIGDAPVGLLDDVRQDPATGRISLTAKLSVGLHSCPIHDNVPSHDLLSFNGVLTGETLGGRVRMENRLDSPPAPGDFRTVVMRRDRACAMESYADHEAWLRAWAPTLSARGPRW
jgi:hypothetical protein